MMYDSKNAESTSMRPLTRNDALKNQDLLSLCGPNNNTSANSTSGNSAQTTEKRLALPTFAEAMQAPAPASPFVTLSVAPAPADPPGTPSSSPDKGKPSSESAAPSKKTPPKRYGCRYGCRQPGGYTDTNLRKHMTHHHRVFPQDIERSSLLRCICGCSYIRGGRTSSRSKENFCSK